MPELRLFTHGTDTPCTIHANIKIECHMHGYLNNNIIIYMLEEAISVLVKNDTNTI